MALKNIEKRVDKMLNIADPDPKKLYVQCFKAWDMGSGAPEEEQKYYGPPDENGFRSFMHELRYQNGTKEGTLIKSLTHSEYCEWEAKLQKPTKKRGKTP